jgi:hypothetical protein
METVGSEYGSHACGDDQSTVEQMVKFEPGTRSLAFGRAQHDKTIFEQIRSKTGKLIDREILPLCLLRLMSTLDIRHCQSIEQSGTVVERRKHARALA